MERTHHSYLVPGFLGFANLGQITYFGHVARILSEHLTAAGLEPHIHIARTPPTASLPARAARVVELIDATAQRGGAPLHLIGYLPIAALLWMGPVGEHRLLERIGEHARFVIGREGPRPLKLGEDVENHPSDHFASASADRALRAQLSREGGMKPPEPSPPIPRWNESVQAGIMRPGRRRAASREQRLVDSVRASGPPAVAGPRRSRGASRCRLGWSSRSWRR